MEEQTLASYSFDAEGMPVNVRIVRRPGEFVPIYEIAIPGLAEGTKLVLNTQIKGELITEVKLDISEIVDPKQALAVKKKFEEKSARLLERHFPTLDESSRRVLASYLLMNTLGLGELEAPMHDENLEEVAVNSGKEPVWVYHKTFGWCKTNINLKSDDAVYDYSSMIGRRVGKQLNILNPLMDAHLATGDRVNATLFPISPFGNTLTIRKFSRNPWTIPTLIELKTIDTRVAGLIWTCIQNELSMLISGGSGSGKTSFLNAIACFFPPTQRVISIEDTREITLPKFLQWVALSTREPNPEGKGEVTMLDLMVNSLRMRPDRIVVGEVRKQREAEILFEAMHTGHAVYATFHADNAAEAVTRLTTPPISMPKSVLPALSAIVVQYRNRKLGIRRTLEFAEVLKSGDVNVLYRWDIKADALREVNAMSALVDTLTLYAGMTVKEVEEDIAEKAGVLAWMVRHGIKDVDAVGAVVARYYASPQEILELVRADKPFEG
ncbi:MAG: type II/IV secretion system ATPase subunit [Candidatus Micrarchaeia archaeon]